ncbi:hypothetical protein I4F81_010666 [Pyropia yezoensis]|uniref:Uncharacterized protein n=1 Tax=Pyropia yezoensis TaxID=2788 RepID=A0ACC3CDC7_PYRYE|nr:hypothetical protein I4F81_010666 [Neopyropia yezoensis]
MAAAAENMAFRWEGSHLDDKVAARLYTRSPIPDATLQLYRGMYEAGADASTDEWLNDFSLAVFEPAPVNAAALNALVLDGGHPGRSPPPTASSAPNLTCGTASRPPQAALAENGHVSPGPAGPSLSAPAVILQKQKLPKGMTTVDAVLTAWEVGIDGLLPMSVFVGNKHPTFKLGRNERKQLGDHLRIAVKVLGGDGVAGVGREKFRVDYEMDPSGKPRTLEGIRVLLEKEAAAKIGKIWMTVPGAGSNSAPPAKK